MGFHRSAPLLPSLTPRAKASSSWLFLSCLLALWVIKSPPLFPSAPMLSCSGSHRLSISSEERCSGETWVLCRRRCRQQPSAEVAATLHSPLTQEGDWRHPARGWLCIWSDSSGSSQQEEQRERVASGRPEGRSVPHTMALFHTPRKRERTGFLIGRGQEVESEGSRVLSGPLHTAQRLCKEGSIVQKPSLLHRAHSH